MNTKELLEPRYKVIALWPNTAYEVGEMISIYSLPLPNSAKDFFDQYPHLFKKLEWWEDRKVEDMPEYVTKQDGKVRKVKQHFCDSLGGANQYGCQLVIDKKIEETLWNYFPYRTLVPATESEYEQFKATQSTKPSLKET